MPRGKIDRPLAGVGDEDGRLQFRAQLECDSPERASAARVPPRLVKPNSPNTTGFTTRVRREPDSLRPYLRNNLPRPKITRHDVGTHIQCCIPQCSITAATHQLVLTKLQWRESGRTKDLLPRAS
jgi:hypothetical protein